MAGQGTRAAMAERGARAAMAGQGTREAMADRGAWVVKDHKCYSMFDWNSRPD